jgi:5-methylcytosine-specific restriction endonuclease McrA
MAPTRKPLARLRKQAFIKQNGACFYCNQPMWLVDPCELTSRYKITPARASKLRCTGEHLVAHSDGGRADARNIVAACQFCNRQRHLSKEPKSPAEYRKYVRRRLDESRWHGLRLQK